MNPPELQYTWNNITIQYSDDQKSRVTVALAAITTLLAEKTTIINNLLAQRQKLDEAYTQQENIIIGAQAQLNNYCNTLFWTWDKQQCIDNANAAWNSARQVESNIIEQINAINNDLNTNIPGSTINIKDRDISDAKQNLNNVIATIQNEIKLQIQAQLANSNSATQNASNIAGINQNNPALLQAQLLAQQEKDLLALKNQAAQDKLKQEQNIKITTFTLVTVAILAIAYVLIRRA